jgi:hypothetical protein
VATELLLAEHRDEAADNAREGAQDMNGQDRQERSRRRRDGDPENDRAVICHCPRVSLDACGRLGRRPRERIDYPEPLKHIKAGHVLGLQDLHAHLQARRQNHGIPKGNAVRHM